MNRLLIILLFPILLTAIAVTAQTTAPDSLENRLLVAEETEKIPILLELIELTQQNQPQTALYYAAEADKLLNLYPDPVYEALLLNRTGWIYYYLNDFDTALQFAQQAEQLAQSGSDSENITRSKLLRGRLLRQRGEYDLAIASLDSALVRAEETNIPLLISSVLNETGSIYRRKGETLTALDYHSRALDIIEPTGDKPALSATYNFLGIMHDIIGNYDEALRYHLQSLAVREELSDNRGMAASMTNIGTLHQRIGQYNEALSFYLQSMPIWKGLNARDELATTLNNIGAVYELLAEYEQARSYYNEAYEIWKEIGDLYSITISLDNLGAIYMYLGDFDQALAYKKETLKNHLFHGNSRGSSNTLNTIAMIYHKTMQPDSALAAAHQSLDMALETNSWSLIRNAHEILSDIYEESDDFESALKHHKLFKAAHDTLFNADSQTIISEMQEQYQTRQQRQQIELLQQERELQRLWLVSLIGGFGFLLIVLFLLYNRSRSKVRTRDQLHRAELEKARLYAESIDAKTKLLDAENKRKTMELEDARKLQLSMLPDRLPENKHASIAAFMETAAEVGGDYYDVALSEDGTLTFCIGDATGHGTRAGLLVTAMKSLFSLMSEEKDLITIIRRCSEAIRKMNLPRLYMAFALVRLKNFTLELAGAGMPAALIYRAATAKVESIQLKGMPLGSLSDYPYVQTTTTFQPDDVLLLLSDGFPEMTNQNGEMLGYDKPAEFLAEKGHLEPEEIVEMLRQKVQTWTGSANGRPDDDITFLVIRKKALKRAYVVNTVTEQPVST